MTHRPSTTIMTWRSALSDRGDRSLRGRLVFIAGAAAVIVLGAVTYAGLVVLKKTLAGDEDARIVNAAMLSRQLVDRVLAERTRQVDLIASSPSTIAAAKKGGEVSREKGLPKLSIDQLEAMFKVTRSQQVDPAAKAFLSDLVPKFDIAEVMVTDGYGYNAVTTSPSSDFVQSDEAWWQIAWTNGATTALATADPATQRTVVELAAVIRDGGTRVGVVKVKFGLSWVDSVLQQGSTADSRMRVDLVDSAGRILASSAAAVRFKPFASYGTVAVQSPGTSFPFNGDSLVQRGAVGLTNNGRWRVIAHMNDVDAGHSYKVARAALVGGVGIMMLVVMVGLAMAGQFIHRRITGPALDLAKVAEAVAGGDLSKTVNQIRADDEIGRLAKAVAAMIDELRRLAGALNESAGETANMTAEINASSEEMAASAGQIAHTASDLSHQANLMAETIQTLAGSSEQLVSLAADLDGGATEGVQRNTQLRALALENRARLDESSQSLVTLSNDVEASATAIDQLAQASEEVRSFVTLVQKLARQSKLLALNAAMEAARAGDHGHGFAVVAEEVRRLAAMSSDAAERTDRVMSGVLRGIADSRASSERTMSTVRTVRTATEEGSRSFGQIENAVAEADGWTSSIQRTAVSTNDLSRDLRAKLDTLATGTESFAAAMEEVAASSEEQSASTQEIAAAAGTLAGAAERLGKLAANLRIDERAVVPHTAEAPAVGTPDRASELSIKPRVVAGSIAKA